MIKRSLLRTGKVSIDQLVFYLVLAGIVLLLGYRFVWQSNGDESGTSFLFPRDENTSSLIDNRGTIYDRNFKELAVTLDRVSVYANVRDINPDTAANSLAPLLGVSSDVLRTMLESESYRVWLAKNISQEVEEAITALNLAGVNLHRERVRYYPEKETAAHVLGFVGKSIGLAGVEYSYNSLLDKYGAIMPHSGGGQKAETKGKALTGEHLILTLDLKIQRILEEFVGEQGRMSDGGKFAALLMECTTGNIIGSAGYPSYDPNNFHEYSQDELINILNQPILIPAQIKRILWDASLLQSRFEAREELLPWSIHSNQRGLGSQLRLWDRLGLNDPLGVDFVTDEDNVFVSGFVDMEQKNSFDSVAETASPLHIVTALNSLVMGGPKVVPRAIDRISDRNGHVYELLPEITAETINPAVASEVQKLLEAQMTAGPVSSGFVQADSLSYMETDNVRQYVKNTMLFSTIPREKPKLVLFVFAKLPVFLPPPAEAKSRFGLVDAAQHIVLPMVVLQEVMSNLSDMMSAEEKREMNFELDQQAKTSIVASGIGQEPTFQSMPDLKGHSLRKSLRLLKDLKLEIQISGTGVVVEQKPKAGVQVKYGELCRLVLKPH